MMNLIKVFFLLFSFFVANVPLTSAVIASSNPVDEELTKMEIPKENYKIDLESNEDISTLLFLENKEKYSIYFYKPSGIRKYTMLSIQIGIAGSDDLEILNDDGFLFVDNYNLTLEGYSSNDCVAKYSVVGLMESIHQETYRRYSLRQIYVKFDNNFKPGPMYATTIPTWQTLGDEYLYYNDEEGKTTYHYKKANYVNILNKVVYSYYFEYTSEWDKMFGLIGAYEHYFYGFTPDRKIDDLQEVELIYKHRSVSGYKAVPTSDYYKPLPYANENDLEYKPKYGEEEKADVIILKGETEEVEKTYWFRKKKVKWNRISTYDELIENADKTFGKNIEKYFKGNEYIVNFAGFPCLLVETKLLENLQNEFNDFFDYLISNNAKLIMNTQTGKNYSFYRYKGTYVNQIQLIRMRYETDGEEFNIQVITNPIDSSGILSGTDKPETPWWWQVVKFVFWLIVISLLLKILIPILKLILYPFKKLWELIMGK